MANLQKALDALQPYVIGIRYLDGFPVVDAVFKEGWFIPESDVIKRVKGNDDVNYYMVFSEKDGIGLDELLEYVDTVIKANVEREKKHELLKQRVNELKEIFKKTSLNKLKKLKFTFIDEDLVPDITDFDEAIIDVTPEEPKQEEIIIQEQPQQPIVYENMSQDDVEFEEEELRAQNYLKIKEQSKLNGVKAKLSSKVELPPRISHVESDVLDVECDCGPNDACDKCIDNKTL